MEIERKFTISHLPENLTSYPCRIIEQAYLNTDPVIRIRREDDSYYLTYKGKGLLAREEYNLPLNAASYEHLLKKADGNLISKKRYLIPIDRPQFDMTLLSVFENNIDQLSLCVELDIFEPPFAPLVIAEVEFPDKETAEAFLPLDWFSQDVTNDPAYHNSNLSRQTF
ncbi:MAG: CYTH domain-containing protein [Bacteroidales bacterium]|nr:CYTH domain-containing protein [Bacteroidales bacterium]MCM1415639.1 CYTH domain-containing protein [bacterium]MCM1422959.1 CYTH domain-containing protein [bacterium]